MERKKNIIFPQIRHEAPENKIIFKIMYSDKSLSGKEKRKIVSDIVIVVAVDGGVLSITIQYFIYV